MWIIIVIIILVLLCVSYLCRLQPRSTSSMRLAIELAPNR